MARRLPHFDWEFGASLSFGDEWASDLGSAGKSSGLWPGDSTVHGEFGGPFRLKMTLDEGGALGL